VPTLSFDGPDGAAQSLTVERIVNCGFTGRDEAAVQAHIRELEEEGVPAPDDFPTFYPKPHHLLTTDGQIKVAGERTSGEAEFVLLQVDGTTHVGVGSDHTDRELERADVLTAKLVCQNVMGESLWLLDDVLDHWDELVLRSWVVDDGERVPYQEATLDAIRRPGDLLSLVDDRLRAPLDGTAIFSGSVATMTEELRPGERFEVELHDPERDRSLDCTYHVDVVDWLV
jgi:hypothetical protein